MELFILYPFNFAIFLRIGRHVIPCIHCLLTSKKEPFYTKLLHRSLEYLPQLSATNGMSDWEKDARNPFSTVSLELIFMGANFTLHKIYGGGYKTGSSDIIL